MRIDFDDKSFLEIKLGSPGKIAIILGAKKKNDNLRIEVNSCEIKISQFMELIFGMGIPITKPVTQEKQSVNSEDSQ